MSVWDALYFRSQEFKPDPTKTSAWNRGAFLVEGPGHCGACHTPKTPLGGDINQRTLGGYSVQGWFAPDIAHDKGEGLGGWTFDEIVTYLKTGHNRFAGATGPMAEEIARSSSQISAADLSAIATYLSNQEGRAESPSGAAPSSSVLEAGGAIYHDVCSACHALDGHGVANLYPALALAPAVRAANPQSLIRVVLQGARSVATGAEPTAPAMPAFAWQLSDAQIAAVLTYLRNRWGAKAPPVEPNLVKSGRERLAEAGK